LRRCLGKTLAGYQEALDLARPDDHTARGGREHQLGVVYGRAGDVSQALTRYQRAIGHHEAAARPYAGGQARFNIALLLARAGRPAEGLTYARAALDNFQQTGPGGQPQAATAARLVTDLTALAAAQAAQEATPAAPSAT
jgi:tetratricopeptide (TPR) repeat protein